MKFCSRCGNSVISRVPDGDNRERFVCDACDTVHYQNPNNVAGAILTWQDSVLLCKRAIEPRYGLWTLPAGFMENNETVAQAAARESMEEANAQCGRLKLFGVFSLPYISQVYMMFSGQLLSDQVSPGMESLEVGLFTRDQIPWDEMAFPVVTHSLELFFKFGAEAGRVHQARLSRSADRVVEFHDELAGTL
jgi:ADP-ribose pyrophosphatase YjhB (NUDIX family)